MSIGSGPTKKIAHCTKRQDSKAERLGTGHLGNKGSVAIAAKNMWNALWHVQACDPQRVDSYYIDGYGLQAFASL